MNKPKTEEIESEPVPGLPKTSTVDDEETEESRKERQNWRDKIDLSHIDDEEFRARIMAMLEKYSSVFEGKLGTISATKHRIRLKPGSSPVHMNPYRAGPDKRDRIRKEIEYQLAAGVIEPAQSEWASPVLLAPKKDGTDRFCVDFRRLNAATIPDSYPLPRMDDCIDSLSEAKVFTLLDALWGYWQVPLGEEDKDKTTFTTHMGTFRYLRMPFGLRNAPASFQRALDIILSGVRWKMCLVYIDDIIVFSKDREEHLEHLEHVLSLLQGSGIKLKLKKCFFFKDEVEYLGFRIRPGTLSVNPDQNAIASVKNALFPQTPTEMKSFLGACNVYRRFIKSFAKTSTPLTDMLKKDSGVEWGEDIAPTEAQRLAFEALKEALTTPPILALPKRNRPYMIDCDASAYAIGAALLQQQDEDDPKSWATVGFFSKTLTPEQRNYSATERECYAVVWSVLTLRPYLEGAHFLVRTDHNALKWLLTLEDPTGRLMRWRLRLMEFDYEIIYRPGLKHQVPDALSRLRHPPGAPNSEVDDEIPTFKTDMADIALVNVTTRRQSRQSREGSSGVRSRDGDAVPMTSDAAPPGVEQGDGQGQAHGQSDSQGVAHPLVRTQKLNRARDHTWTDDSFLPLPREDNDDDERDLIADARDAIQDGMMNDVDEVHTAPTPDSELPAPLTLDEILEAQASDEYCQSVLVAQVGRKGSPFFEDDSGLLCRNHPRDPDVIQIVLPLLLRHRVLRLAHYHPLAGHPGQTRLLKRLRRTYYWPQMSADAATTVRECISCAKNRVRLLRQAGAMKLFQAVRPLEDLAIDILGPLPKSKQGYSFILVITDRFSKLTQAVPLKAIKATDVSVALVNEWLFKYGAPKRLLSDNGSQFVSDLFSRVCDMLRVHNACTMTYHPQTNGQTERFNRTLTAMLRCYVEDHPSDWSEYVRALTYAYNTAVHRGLEAAPFDLVLSRSPPDFTMAQPTRARGKKGAGIDRQDYVIRLRIAIGRASANLKKHQRRYKADFDRRVRRAAVKLTTDDAVFLDLNDGAKKRDKLAHNVGGAYKVLEVDKATKTVVIQRGDVAERVSMNRVTRAPTTAKIIGPSSGLDHAATPQDLAEKTQEGESWYFKDILDHRTLDDGTVEFKLDWEGYRPSWVARKDVPEESVSRYFARLNNARRRSQATVTVFNPGLFYGFLSSRFTSEGDHELLVDWKAFPPSWMSTKHLPKDAVWEYIWTS